MLIRIRSLWSWWPTCYPDQQPLRFIELFDSAVNGTWLFITVQETSLLFGSFPGNDFSVKQSRVYICRIAVWLKRTNIKKITNSTWELKVNRCGSSTFQFSKALDFMCRKIYVNLCYYNISLETTKLYILFFKSSPLTWLTPFLFDIFFSQWLPSTTHR